MSELRSIGGAKWKGAPEPPGPEAPPVLPVGDASYFFAFFAFFAFFLVAFFLVRHPHVLHMTRSSSDGNGRDTNQHIHFPPAATRRQ